MAGIFWDAEQKGSIRRMTRKNPLRELLNAGRPSVGTRMHSSWPTIIELIGQSGDYDYVEIVAEYAPYDAFSLENQGRAIDLFDHFCGMVKVPQELRSHTAVRALNAGIQNMLFADVRTATDAKECIQAVRAESPHTGGLRGVGQGRDVGITQDVGTPAFVQSTADTVVALMIEKKESIENLDDILSVPGVDMVQFGPVDYAMSIGRTGERSHPEVREAQRYLIERADAHGVACRAEIADPDGAKAYLDMGIQHFCMGMDVRILSNWYKANGSDLRRQLPRQVDTA